MINLKSILIILSWVQIIWAAPKYALVKSDLQVNWGRVGLGSSLDIYSKSNYGYGLGLEASGDFAIPGMTYKFTEDFRIVNRVIKEEYYSREWVLGLGVVQFGREGTPLENGSTPGTINWGPSVRIESSWLWWYRFAGFKARTFFQIYGADWKPQIDLGVGLGFGVGY